MICPSAPATDFTSANDWAKDDRQQAKAAENTIKSLFIIRKYMKLTPMKEGLILRIISF